MAMSGVFRIWRKAAEANLRPGKKGKSQDVKVDKRMAIDYVATYILLLLMEEIQMKSQTTTWDV